MKKEHLENIKSLWDVFQSVATVIAIIVGGVWTYTNFIEQRENHVRLQLTLAASDIQVAPGHKLLIVDENLANLGARLVRLRKGDIRVIQVLPIPDGLKATFDSGKALPVIEDPNAWTVLNKPDQDWVEDQHVIEPGEADQIRSQVLLSDKIQVVEILAYVYNPEVKPGQSSLGWRVQRLYDLRTHTLMPAESNASAKAAE